MTPRPLSQQLLDTLLDGRDLAEAEAHALVTALSGGEVPPALAGALLVALRQKGETAAEVRGAARALLDLARPPELPGGGATVDVVGTGGDGSDSVNLSTGAALLSASLGLRIVKHGNRAVSSRCGSADVLAALGLDLERPDPAAALARSGFCFLFAPDHHPAMRHVAPVRRALGVRTVFNLLGPLVNPARPDFMLVGSYSLPAARLLAGALAGLDVERAFVVHGTNGWDEPTPACPFHLLEVADGQVREVLVDPADHGLAPCTEADLRGGEALRNAHLLRAALGGRPGPVQDALVLGAGLVAQVSGLAPDLDAGLHLARRAVATGAAALTLARLPAPRAGAREVRHG